MNDHPSMRTRLIPAGPGGGGDTTGLPHDMLHAASRRLGLAALLYGTVYVLAYMVGKISILADDPNRLENLPYARFYQTITLIAIVLAGGMYALTKHKRLTPKQVLGLGLWFEVVGAFLIYLAEMWAPAQMGEFGVQRVSWVGMWIITFPMLVPSSPKKILLASLAAAATGPLSLALVTMSGASLPPLGTRILMFAPTLICVGIAFTVSKIIYRMGSDVREAREMGSYRLAERLGLGGMGEVWRAEHRMLARPAAIKLIRPEALGAEGSGQHLIARFEREAQTTAALKSPHTVQLYDFGVTAEGTFYYVMELLNGLDMESLIRKHGPLPAERVLHLLRQTCHSLAEAHHAGLVHRDIKPANIYLCRLGLDHDFVKVLDFGLVKARRAPEQNRLTMTDTTSGTPAYMPPELAMGEEEIDGRADLYSLGCVGYWLLTGELVFEATSPMQVIIDHVQTPPTPPSQRTELPIPEELERIILKCLEKRPLDRHQTATELARELDRCGSPRTWSPERAMRWWDTHLPATARPAPARLTARPAPSGAE